MFTIFCIGSYDLLIQVLNGLAMLTSATGPAGYGGMVALGLAVGTLLAVARGVVTQKLDLHWILVGWLLYAVMFVPKVTVTVQDVYTGRTNVVDNVPIGPAAIGGLTSQVGVRLTQAMETVFTLPSLTGNGYADSLKMLTKMRDIDFGDANDGVLDNKGLAAGGIPTTVDYGRSIQQYLIRCVMFAMNSNVPGYNMTMPKLSEAEDLWAALEVNAANILTPLWVDEGQPYGTMFTCKAAWDRLSGDIPAKLMPAYTEYAGRLLQIPAGTANARVQVALDTLLGAGKDAQTYMRNAILKKQMELAQLGYASEANDVGTVAMLTQAMEQRRVQWASEKTFFEEMARPLMSYIEAYFYAVAPIVAFLLTLGAFGISLFGRYLMVAVWIQLWAPLMAINNLYIQMSAAGELTRLQSGGFNAMSMVGLDSIWTKTESYLATGGMLAAATPLLALMLISGSYFAFTSLTNRMSGGDHVDEKVVRPDVLQTGAVASVQSMASAIPRVTDSPMNGSVSTGAMESGVLGPALNFRESFGAAASSAHRASMGAATNVAHEFGTAINSSHGNNFDSSVSQYMKASDSASHSRTDDLLTSRARDFVHNDAVWSQLSNETRTSLKMALSGEAGGSLSKALPAGASGSAGKGLLGAGGSLGYAIDEVASKTNGTREDVAAKLQMAAQEAQRDSLQLGASVSNDMSTGEGRRFLKTLGVEQNEGVRSAVSDYQNKEDSYQSAKSQSAEVGTSGSIHPVTIANQMLNGAGSQADREKQVRDFGSFLASRSSVDNPLYSRWDTRAGEQEYYGRHLNNDKEKAHLVAGMQLVNEHGTDDDKRAMYQWLSQHHYMPVSKEIGDAHMNSSIGNEVNEGGARSAFDRENVPMESHASARQLISNISSEIKSPEEFAEKGHQAVDDYFKNLSEGRRDKAEEALHRIEALGNSEQGKMIESQNQDPRSATKMLAEAGFGNTMRDLGKEFNTIGHSWDAVKSGPEANKAYRDAYESEMSVSGSRMKATVAGAKAGFDVLSKGYYQFREERNAESYSQAKSAGLPEDAAKFYGNVSEKHLDMMGATGEDIKKVVTGSYFKDFEMSRQASVNAIGETATTMLERAADSDSNGQKKYLGEAATMYKGKQATRSREDLPKPLETKDQSANEWMKDRNK
jgi:TraG-like protein, N-terminal region